jgi:hypothetical protein
MKSMTRSTIAVVIAGDGVTGWRGTSSTGSVRGWSGPVSADTVD